MSRAQLLCSLLLWVLAGGGIVVQATQQALVRQNIHEVGYTEPV